jgi:septum formation protein
MLRLLQNRTHRIHTGLALVNGGEWSMVAEVEVEMAPMSDADISAYVATGEPLDKAGAYAIQGGAKRFIRKVEGDYFAVVGLPLRPLAEHLKGLGFPVDMVKIEQIYKSVADR